MSVPHEVIVVGAGPVGLATALGLARKQVRVTIVEAGASVSHGSRAICMSRHSLEILHRLGVGEQVGLRALPWTSGRSFYRDTEVLSFSMPADPDAVHPPMVNLSQSEAEQILVDAVDRTPGCAIRWNNEVLDVAQHADHVALTVATPDGEQVLRSTWVVAADGARSAVRAALGLELSGETYEGRYVIADIHWRSELPTERKVWFDPPSNPGSTLIMHRQPDDIWRVDYQLGAGDDPEREVDEQRVRTRIARHLEWLGSTAPWTLEWVSIYRAHSLSLDSYVHHRVLFAGDAAHLVPIFGVRGLNSGFEDADVLSWMLALVVHGHADHSLLDVYAAERRDAWRQNVESARLSTLFMTPGTRGYKATRDAVLALANRRPVLRHLVNPRQSSATHARRSALTQVDPDAQGKGPLPGDPIADRWLSSPRAAPGAVSSVGSLQDGGFALLGFDCPEAALIDCADTLRGALEPAVPVQAAVLPDADGALHHHLGAERGQAVLLRPDGLLMARAPFERLPALADALLEHLNQGGRT